MRLVAADPETQASADAALDHADALYRLARYLTHGHADAEDLVQETYARALAAWGRLEAGSDLRAWLLRILRNTHLDRVRAQRRHPTEAGPDEGPVDDTLAADDGWLRGDFELERLRRVVSEEIEAALRRLPEAARTVVLLDAEGLSEAELALVLGCPAGTVKSRLYRARATLRRLLADYRR